MSGLERFTRGTIERRTCCAAAPSAPPALHRRVARLPRQHGHSRRRGRRYHGRRRSITVRRYRRRRTEEHQARARRQCANRHGARQHRKVDPGRCIRDSSTATTTNSTRTSSRAAPTTRSWVTGSCTRTATRWNYHDMLTSYEMVDKQGLRDGVQDPAGHEDLQQPPVNGRIFTAKDVAYSLTASPES